MNPKLRRQRIITGLMELSAPPSAEAVRADHQHASEPASAEPPGEGAGVGALRQAQGLEQAQRVETAGGCPGKGGSPGKGRASRTKEPKWENLTLDELKAWLEEAKREQGIADESPL
jgi:hypothetical protein